MDGENFHIKRDKEIKVTKYDSGDREIQDVTSDGINYLKNIQKKNEREYIDKRTGEVKLYKLNKTKTKEGIKKSMITLKKLLRNNFCGNNNELFVTLTSASDVPDLDIMLNYFKKFCTRLRQSYPDIEYVCIPEKHKNRNSWHLHILLKNFNHKSLYIPNDDVEYVYWKQGQTKTSRITNKNIKTIINEEEKMLYSEEANIEEEFGIDRLIEYLCKTQTKENIPRNSHCYYKSKNIKFPTTETARYGDVYDEMGNNYQLKIERTTLLRSLESDKIIRKIKTERWTKINFRRNQE